MGSGCIWCCWDNWPLATCWTLWRKHEESHYVCWHWQSPGNGLVSVGHFGDLISSCICGLISLAIHPSACPPSWPWVPTLKQFCRVEHVWSIHILEFTSIHTWSSVSHHKLIGSAGIALQMISVAPCDKALYQLLKSLEKHECKQQLDWHEIWPVDPVWNPVYLL